jgi:hypothetical protein
MCTPLSVRLISIVVAALLIGCGGDLTLPADGSPAALTTFAGNGQEGTVGSRLDAPLVVRVTDSDSRPVADVAVVFRFDVPGAEINPSQATTDTLGLASAQARLGDDAGPQTVEAQVAPASASNLRATFDLTAVPDEKGKGKHGKGDKHDED